MRALFMHDMSLFPSGVNAAHPTLSQPEQHLRAAWTYTYPSVTRFAQRLTSIMPSPAGKEPLSGHTRGTPPILASEPWTRIIS